MSKKKLSIGITGNIGSGKSTFAGFVKERNFPVINADDLAKKILNEDKQIQQKVTRTFGEKCFTKGSLNKSYLAEIVFSNESNVQKLNSIIHPEVIKQSKVLVTESFKEHSLVFTEAALIYEADMEEQFDYIVLITAPIEVRMQRATTSGKLSGESFLLRDANQIPEDEKKKRADFVFENSGSKKDLEKKTDLLVMILSSL
ncbi:MAG: dephospho-CoA kinase [Ignavibacteriales bacterium]|nr:MAG: dephospho-CoA kinase [Ignavibacteriales bacterium]